MAQVDRQGCALILADTWPDKIGKGLMFISLNVEPATREDRGRRAGCAARRIRGQGRSGQGWFVGLPASVVDDLDGNQLFFNYPSETASGKSAGENGIIVAIAY